MVDFSEYTKKLKRTRSEIWDIRVDPSFQENTVEYKPSHHVVIRATSIDFALSLVQRGRDLMAKYS